MLFPRTWTLAGNHVLIIVLSLILPPAGILPAMRDQGGGPRAAYFDSLTVLIVRFTDGAEMQPCLDG